MTTLTPPTPEFQQNIKILLDKQNEGYQPYRIVDNNDNHLFETRTVIAQDTMEETINEINTDYCFWYRTVGFKMLRKYYSLKN
jgi:hypothetical protein